MIHIKLISMYKQRGGDTPDGCGMRYSCTGRRRGMLDPSSLQTIYFVRFPNGRPTNHPPVTPTIRESDWYG